MVIRGIGDRARAAIEGLVLDQLVGEPPRAVHPVAAFGRSMERVERMLYRDTRAAGMQYAAVGIAIGYGAGHATPDAVTVASVVAARELRHAAVRVRDALVENDLVGARERVVVLVGRDPSALDKSQLAAAVIESVAENTVDAVIAPVWWTLAGGAGTAGAYRAVNTMDAMVGHRTPRHRNFGWASACLDDVMNYLPARFTALLVAVVRPARRAAIRHAVRTQAAAHPSPNAGVAEAAFAAALGIELGGPLRYGDRYENRPQLGCGPRPTTVDIDRALALAAHVELALGAVLAATYLATRSR